MDASLLNLQPSKLKKVLWTHDSGHIRFESEGKHNITQMVDIAFDSSEQAAAQLETFRETSQFETELKDG